MDYQCILCYVDTQGCDVKGRQTCVRKTMKKLILPTNINYFLFTISITKLPYTNCHIINFTWNIVQIQNKINSNKLLILQYLQGWTGILQFKVMNYFLTPSVLFLSLIWLLWHFLHLSEDIGFFAPHLKQILKYSLRCWAICFFTVSVIGIYIKIS